MQLLSFFLFCFFEEKKKKLSCDSQASQRDFYVFSVHRSAMKKTLRQNLISCLTDEHSAFMRI